MASDSVPAQSSRITQNVETTNVAELPRIVMYQQTHHLQSGEVVSILPLRNTGITHLIIAAIHLNEGPGNITLNDHPPSDSRFKTLWREVRALQSDGIIVTGMLGGAAKGSFQRLDGPPEQFEAYYCPLREIIKEYGLQGLDLDVEEEMSLPGVLRLIDRLKSDFGEEFVVTLAPVAPALRGGGNLSGFDYRELELLRRDQISFYNAQFYCGWGDMSHTKDYEKIIFSGVAPERFVVGLSTNPLNANGYVPFEVLIPVLLELRDRFPTFGGVMGWEYYNARSPGCLDTVPTTEPWRWASTMNEFIGRFPGVVRDDVKKLPHEQATA